jgi:ribokinase
MDFVGIGALNLDHIYEMDERYYLEDMGLKEGEEVVFEERQEEMLKGRLALFGRLKKISPGGSAANTIHMLSLLGFKAGLFGALGKDREAETYLSLLGGEDRRKIVRRGRTSVAYIMDVKGGERTIVVVPKARLKREDIDLSYLSEAHWIHMSSLPDEEGMVIQRLIKEELKGSVKFSIDPGRLYSVRGEAFLSLLSGMDVLFVTEKELSLIFGENEADAVSKALKLVRTIVVKRGQRGASLYGLEGELHAKAESVEKVDDTGAGDVLAGIFLGCMKRGLPPSLSLRLAVIGASLSVGGYGRESYPKKEDLERALEDLLVHDRKG